MCMLFVEWFVSDVCGISCVWHSGSDGLVVYVMYCKACCEVYGMTY